MKIGTTIMKLDGMHKFDAVNQFLRQFNLNEIRGSSAGRCPEFYQLLKLYLGNLIAGQFCEKMDSKLSNAD